MFHRRLWLLFLGAGGAGAVLAGQSYRLTVAQGERHLAAAEARLVSERWTPTQRGMILDRKGRVLARDEASYDIRVRYRVITEEWAYSEAARRARREHRDAWPTLDRAQRDALVQRLLPEHQATLRAMWADLAQALGLSAEELEQRKSAVRRDVARMAMTVWDRWLEARREEVNREQEVTLEDVQRPLREHQESHPIAQGVAEEVGHRVRRLVEKYPGLEIAPSGRRAYPFETMEVEVDRASFPSPLRAPPPGAPVQAVKVEGVATHIIGWERGLAAEDIARRPRVDPKTGVVDRGHYQPRDRVGARGIEGSHEDTLRGQRGRVTTHRDTGEEQVVEHVPGGDVRLTVDVALQARVQALMDPSVGLAAVQPWHHPAVTPAGQPTPLADGTPLFGAAVVLEIDSGEILAMASTPSFTRDRLQEDAEEIYSNPVEAAWVNKALSKPYPPGSIIKPLVLVSAVSSGAHALGSAVECTGHFLPNRPDRFRCWVFKQFGTTHTGLLGRSLLAPEALAVSCNIYFYTLASRLGVEKVVEWYKAFGIGSGFGLGLDDEYRGVVGEPPPGERLSQSHAILMGIGQGPVAYTPLHAADIYATLARGGLRLMPRVVKSAPPRASDLHLDTGALDAALEGLRQSVQEDFGTGHTLRFPDGTREPIFTDRPGLSVYGKTGTAEAPDILDRDPSDPDAVRVLREGDHSWFVVMVGKKGGPPRFVISVVMEYAGSGGRVSGPIANQIIGALVAEGYL
ncbi:MAG TPA: hypothetical protein DEB06_05785 [Phycisphaerales bacterium]|nr:hypothetical protein [Phycisphaerales bacterium]